MNRLEEIRDTMLELLDEAKSIVNSKCSRLTKDRMRAYWFAQIQMALTDDHCYLGSAGATMQEAIDEIGDEGTEDDDEDDVEPIEPIEWTGN